MSAINLDSPSISEQYRPTKIENEQLLIASLNFHSIENDVLEISHNQMKYISCEHEEKDESQKEKNCIDYSVQDKENNVEDVEQRMLERTQS